MNCTANHSGCWYCQTDFKSPLGWWSCDEFDTVMHVECIEYEHNECRDANYYYNEAFHNKYKDVDPWAELDIILNELGYVVDW